MLKAEIAAITIDLISFSEAEVLLMLYLTSDVTSTFRNSGSTKTVRVPTEAFSDMNSSYICFLVSGIPSVFAISTEIATVPYLGGDNVSPP